MSQLTIIPNQLKGNIDIPPSKSMAHRAIICASLAKGVSVIRHIDFSDDMIATIQGMRALGAKIEKGEDYLRIDGSKTLETKEALIECNESGSTLRFLVPISIATPSKVRFMGNGNLGKRPLDIFYKIFDRQEIKYSYKEGEMDLKIEGQLSADIFEIPGNVSSQFITGLLFTLPLLKQDSKIILTTELESKGYIDLTLQMLKRFGIVIENKNNSYREFNIRGNQHYKPAQYTVEGDYSQAAFYFVAGALGSDVICNLLEKQSAQGDKACIDILKEMGAVYKEIEEGISLKEASLKGVIVDAKQYPDIIPVIVVALSVSEGESHVINGSRLRIKECDRLHAIAKELNQLGAHIQEDEDCLHIKGVPTLRGGRVHSHYDHRIAMSMAIASTKCTEPVILEAPECVSKSYPGFWEDFKSLGGNYKWEKEEEK